MIRTNKTLPTVDEFYINTSLYDKFLIANSDKGAVFNLIYYAGTIDCFCPTCGQVSVFQADNNRPIKNRNPNLPSITINDSSEWTTNIEDSTFHVIKIFKCVRNNQHQLTFYISISDKILQKVGQLPSIADLNSFGIAKFKKILGHELYSEFNRGIGLFSHGVGVGSFVYLRRIIENFIIKPAYEEAKKSTGWDDEEFQKLRVTERIKKLKEYLPDFLVQNSTLYSIVSKGIHELTEDECNEYFPVLRECMEYVLTEIQAQKEMEEQKKILTKKIGEIAGKIK